MSGEDLKAFHAELVDCMAMRTSPESAAAHTARASDLRSKLVDGGIRTELDRQARRFMCADEREKVLRSS